MQQLALLVALATISLLSASLAEAFAFDLPAKSYRCFTQEIPTGVEVQIQFVATPGYAQFVDTKLTSHEGVLLWEETGQDRGTYSTTMEQGGDFALCFYSRLVPGAKHQDGMKRTINLEFKIATETQDYQKLATNEHLKPLEVNLRIMEDTVRALHAEYAYYKDSERAMRDTQEHMNAKVMWMTVLVMSLVVGLSLWQTRHLKSYFKRKRMID
jgi:hypothetical protein